MKYRIFILATLLLLVGVAFAVHGSGTVVGSFSIESYTDIPECIAWDGSSFWVTDSHNHYIYKITTTGSLISSYPTTPTFTGPTGISWDGSAFWVIGKPSGNLHNFYHISTSGSVLSSIPGVITYNYPYGAQYLGGNCWVADNNYDRKIYLHSLSNGAILSTVQTIAKYPGGICYDGSNLLVSGGEDGWTHRYSTSGSYMDYFLPPFAATDYEGGTVWANGYLYWINTHSHIVYQISVDWNPPAAEPVSLGVVRSLFK
jgi:hypothetical protein